MAEQVIIVDENDNEAGVSEKIKAHEAGLLHRAFSVFIFNSKKELLLQKRASSKYHSGGLWSMTCCGHPRPKEKTKDAAKRRLKEEMGFDCSLKKVYSFIYKAKFDNGLTEYEYDNVFVGNYEENPIINPEEAEEWKWADPLFLRKDIKENPENYTYWFKICADRVLNLV